METADMMRVNIGADIWAIQTLSEARCDQIGRGVTHDPGWKRKNRHPIDHGAGVNVRDIVDTSLGNIINDHARELSRLIEDLYDTTVRVRSTYVQKWDHKGGETAEDLGGGEGWVTVTFLETSMSPSGDIYFPDLNVTYEGVKGRTLFFPNSYARNVKAVYRSMTTIRTKHL